MALYVLSGARGQTSRAINALSVSIGYQSCFYLAGESEHGTKIAIRDFADVPDRDVLGKGSCGIEQKLHVNDIRDIPTPNILVEDFCRTALISRPSGDVQMRFACACVHVRLRSEYIT